MIKYALTCDAEHKFDGWFANAAAFDRQKADGLLACALCGSPHVSKAIMAPAVPKKANQMDDAKARDMLEKVSVHVEENFDYVGTDFAEEARKIHYGETPEREIYGETSLEDAKELIDEGVPVAPLPVTPSREKN